MANLTNFTTLKGDTWHGATLTVAQSGSPMNITGASLKMQLRKTVGANPVLELSTDDNTIQLTSPASGQFIINKMIIDLTTGVYRYDLQMTLNGDVTTLLGGTFTITSDITE